MDPKEGSTKPWTPSSVGREMASEKSDSGTADARTDTVMPRLPHFQGCWFCEASFGAGHWLQRYHTISYNPPFRILHTHTYPRNGTCKFFRLRMEWPTRMPICSFRETRSARPDNVIIIVVLQTTRGSPSAKAKPSWVVTITRY